MPAPNRPHARIIQQVSQENPMATGVERIADNIHKLRQALKKAPKRLSPSKVHQVRTQVRRVESILDALSLDTKRGQRRLLKDLGKIRKMAGKVRDMDVLSAHLATVRLEQDQRDSVVEILEYLGAKRYRYAQRLHFLMKKRSTSIRRRLKNTSARLEKILNQKKGTGHAPPETLDAVMMALRLSEELASPHTLQKKNLHPYRLKVKELPDVLQMAEKPVNEKFIDALGKCKDAIGEWHDWEELVRIAEKVLKDGKTSELLPALKAIVAKKYQAALAVTNKMRVHFILRKKQGKGSRPSEKKDSRPALRVVTAMTA
jgi:CHAD domain-containing protein